ncbi:hypothetical protein M9194_17940 [Vibrio sp. S4M6]|uniref:hypothetical protein n=1 Tax=Vibrio sinus TaxID=2946865 RepID=UPI002029E410|nr:hypothetical protein [Vibrio sinus]MCL9783315.1 hypothetical protein [Vibrio sinus]
MTFTLDTQRNMAPKKKIDQYKVMSLSRLFNWMLVLALLMVPFSVYRASQIGFTPLYTIHLVVTLGAILLYAYRQFITPTLTEIFLACCCVLVGVGSTLSYGFSGNTVSMFMLLLLVLSIQRSNTVVLGFSLVYIIILSVLAHFFIHSTLTPYMSMNDFVQSPLAWISGILVMAMAMAGYGAIRALQTVYLLKANLLCELLKQKQHMERLANYDNLTGLLTKRLAIVRLKMAMKLSYCNQSKRMCCT